jgi:hypothetical protein
MAITSPAVTFSRASASTILAPRSYTVSMSVVLSVMRPARGAPPAAIAAAAPAPAPPPSSGRSTSISTTSPSITSVSSLMRTPIALRNACVRASVLLISREKISEAASMANGASSPSSFAMPIAMAVLPVPG